MKHNLPVLLVSAAYLITVLVLVVAPICGRCTAVDRFLLELSNQLVLFSLYGYVYLYVHCRV